MNAVPAIAVTMLMAMACASGAQSAQVTILANPGPFSSIEEAAHGEERVNFWDADPTDDDACTECFAAVELKRFLTTCCALGPDAVKLDASGKIPADGYVFVLGSARSSALIGSKPAKGLVDPAAFSVRVQPRPGGSVCYIEGKTRVGVLYGAYAYLEALGMRFFGLGDRGTVYPTKTVAPLDGPYESAQNPSFKTRGFYAWEARGNEEFFLWMARNRMNFWTSAEKNVPLLKKLGMRLAIGAHDVQSNFLNGSSECPYGAGKPADPYTPSPAPLGDADHDGKVSYYEAHPEWFGLRDGKRIGDVGAWSKDRINICTSNDDAVAELSKNFVQGLIDGVWRYADVVNFWMVDGSGLWCNCEKCKALGTPTDQLLRIQYLVNHEVRKARRDGRLTREVHLTSLAYSDTIAPPTKPLPSDFDYENCSVTFYPIQRCYVHTMSDPDCTEINKRYADSFLGWSPGRKGNYRGELFVGEYYNVSNYKSMPALYTDVMPDDIRWYYDHGARHMQYMHTLTKGWGTWTLNQYLFARTLWDKSTDAPALLDDYFARYYPTTTRETRGFYQDLESALRNITQIKTYIGLHANRNEEIFPLDHFKYAEYHPSKNDGPDLLETMPLMDKARADLDAALLACTDAKERARLLEDDARFSYAEDMMRFYYHLVRTTMFEARHDEAMARREFALLSKSADALRGYGRNLIETFICPDDGFAATMAVERFNALKAKYGTTPR